MRCSVQHRLQSTDLPLQVIQAHVRELEARTRGVGERIRGFGARICATDRRDVTDSCQARR